MRKREGMKKRRSRILAWLLACFMVLSVIQGTGWGSHPSGRRLFETADIVIDNCCVNKDACLELDGQRRCPLSSMTVLLSGVLLTALLAENEEG